MRLDLTLTLLGSSLLIVLWGFGSWPLVGEAEPQPGESVDARSDSLAIQEQWERWELAAAREDAGMLASVYAEDAVLLPPSSPAVAGRDTIRSLYDSQFRRSDIGYDFEIGELVIADGWAFRRGSYTITAHLPDGSGPTLRQKFMDIWQRQPDGSWRIARDIWNSSEPPDRFLDSVRKGGEAREE